jgi:uncharacterized protein (DUF2235 family)
MINTLFSPESSDVASIIKQAKADFTEHFQTGDDILLTGFSRGGALARRFCTIISEEMPSLTIYQAIFDTVASIGLPNLASRNRPKSDVIFEHGHTLSSTVKQALHMVSLDDKRRAFQPTLMNQDNRVLEVWFSGAHSDVGGGYQQDGLSDITLQFMLDWLKTLSISLELKDVKDIDLKAIFPPEINYEIHIDDIHITPDAFSKNHQQDRLPIINWLTLTDRQCCVIVDDKISDILPIVHHTVIQRINGDENYRPNSLKTVNYKILCSDQKIL